MRPYGTRRPSSSFATSRSTRRRTTPERSARPAEAPEGSGRTCGPSRAAQAVLARLCDLSHGLPLLECVDAKKDGIHFSNAEAGTSRVITWKAIKAHALAHTPEDVRALICDIDAEWCQVQSIPDVPPGQWRYHTAAEKERLAQCVRLLTGLARTVWDPTLAPEATGPVQLDLFDALEGLS